MAAYYLRIIRKVQPSGPYIVLGWSFGGLVAHEIAVQLQSAGQCVALLTPTAIQLPTTSCQLSQDEERDTGIHHPGMADNPLRETLDTLRREGHILSTLTQDHYESIMDAFRNHNNLMKSFTPGRFHGDVLLFMAAQETVNSMVNNWQPHVEGRINVHRIDSTHASILELLTGCEHWAAYLRASSQGAVSFSPGNDNRGPSPNTNGNCHAKGLKD